MALLLDLIGFGATSTARFLCSVVLNACLPRVPPPNWNNKDDFMVRVGANTKHIPTLIKRTVRDSALAMEKYVDLQCLLGSGLKQAISLDDVPALSQIPRPSIEVPQMMLLTPYARESSMTAVDASTSDVDFSIYSDISSPNLNKAMFITPISPRLMSSKDDNLELLRAASDRVSEILRENRRRLDAGEDTSTVRKEARRRRAQELSAGRNNGGSLF
ncbi:hypothetical protein BDZ97DRAFT_433088 [Flammula alnicola]|nr:hypothetical protein BDZ97DRAFT_433088 [Flammula alnicola]